jgi:hypothetical protein
MVHKQDNLLERKLENLVKASTCNLGLLNSFKIKGYLYLRALRCAELSMLAKPAKLASRMATPCFFAQPRDSACLTQRVKVANQETKFPHSSPSK